MTSKAKKDIEVNEDEVVEEKKEINMGELCEFIVRQRESQGGYWWVGVYDPNEKRPTLVSTSLRGFFQKGVWLPIEDELGGECCTSLLSKVKSGKIKDPFAMIEHCATPAHVSNMMRNRPTELIEAEHDHMLSTIMETLANGL